MFTSRKISILLACLCAYLFCNAQGFSNLEEQKARQRLIKEASQFVGARELKKSNDNPVFDYYRAVRGRAKERYLPYCGFGVNAWLLGAGIQHPIKVPEIAKNWITNKVTYFGSQVTSEKVNNLQIGSVAIFRIYRKWNNSIGYHVGIIEKKYSTYCITIEANTSTKQTLGAYLGDNEGQFRKIRTYNYIYAVNDVIKQSTVYKDTLKIFYLKKVYTNDK